MEKPYRLAVKLPAGAEFEAEGNEETVKELFQQFLEAVRMVPTPAPVPATATNKIIPLQDDLELEAGDAMPSPAAMTIDRVTLDRLFAIDRTGTVSLKALPRGEDRGAEALVALLYGFNVMRGETDVTAVRLMKAARQSGIQVARLDRTISTQERFINSAGFGKGKRYGLNNPGLNRAQEILLSILG